MYAVFSLNEDEFVAVKKISKSKIASTYANALYEAAEESKALNKVWADAEKLRNLLRENDDWIKYLANPMVADNDKKDVLKKIAQKLKLDEDTLRCLDVVFENGRVTNLGGILDEFVHVYYRRNGYAEIEVETVKQLSAAQDKRLQQNLEKLLSKKVIVAYKIMPEIIGGLRIKFGSEMIDNSLASKLNRLEIEMKGVQ